jgi:hypothetical protein
LQKVVALRAQLIELRFETGEILARAGTLSRTLLRAGCVLPPRASFKLDRNSSNVL